MKINLNEIYSQLEAWRHERGITAESQKEGYVVNVMEELGELAGALRCYEQIKEFLNKNKGKMCGYQYHKHSLMLIEAEHEIIDAICDIAVFTINAGVDVNCNKKINTINTTQTTRCNSSLSFLLNECGSFDYYGNFSSYICFNEILLSCTKICENYGFNFEIAMLETIKEISSRTGSYDEATKKWVKDSGDEAQAKWYKADYEKARIKQ